MAEKNRLPVLHALTAAAATADAFQRVMLQTLSARLSAHGLIAKAADSQNLFAS